MVEPEFVPDPLLVAVRRLGEVLDRFDDDVARSLGVHRSDLRAMHLLEHGPVTAGAIASHLDLTSGSVTALIARLVKAGLVTRTVDGNDRRVANVALRREAWQRLAAVYGPAGQRVTEYSTTMNPRRRNETVRALHDIANHLDALRENH
ncbi:MAG TPA: MarR family transcriptional regulator [Ilumatobacteraceae bacterium]|nr:MarR family transcriptional regulator [Ilumatobacteraceae bacterium]